MFFLIKEWGAHLEIRKVSNNSMQKWKLLFVFWQKTYFSTYNPFKSMDFKYDVSTLISQLILSRNSSPSCGSAVEKSFYSHSFGYSFLYRCKFPIFLRSQWFLNPNIAVANKAMFLNFSKRNLETMWNNRKFY